MSPVPIGILGGTFDPIHNGHLRLAQEALEQCSLGVIRFVPGGTPPHRNTPRASAEERLDMVRLALHGNQSFELDDREIFRIDPCYTVDTLSTLRAELGATQPLCLLMGGDAFLTLDSWHQWKQLFELSHIVVMQRGGQPLGNAVNGASVPLREEYQARLALAPRVLHESPAGAVLVVDMPVLEISATDIRKRCAERRSIRYLVPDSVADYIKFHHFYT